MLQKGNIGLKTGEDLAQTLQRRFDPLKDFGPLGIGEFPPSVQEDHSVYPLRLGSGQGQGNKGPERVSQNDRAF